MLRSKQSNGMAIQVTSLPWRGLLQSGMIGVQPGGLIIQLKVTTEASTCDIC